MLIDNVVHSRAILQQIISIVGPALSYVRRSRHGLDHFAAVIDRVRYQFSQLQHSLSFRARCWYSAPAVYVWPEFRLIDQTYEHTLQERQRTCGRVT